MTKTQSLAEVIQRGSNIFGGVGGYLTARVYLGFVKKHQDDYCRVIATFKLCVKCVEH